MSYNSGF